MITSPISSKAQTTLPRAVRVALGVGGGDVVRVLFPYTDRAVRQRRQHS